MLLLSPADLFLKLTFSKHSFRTTIRVPNGLNPDLTGFKLFAKVIGRRQKLLLARKELSKNQLK